LPNDADLVTLDAQLLEVLKRLRKLLVLGAENIAFRALRTTLHLCNGSNLRLTGVCLPNLNFAATLRRDPRPLVLLRCARRHRRHRRAFLVDGSAAGRSHCRAAALRWPPLPG
jgi:hypothetical protein